MAAPLLMRAWQQWQIGSAACFAAGYCMLATASQGAAAGSACCCCGRTQEEGGLAHHLQQRGGGVKQLAVACECGGRGAASSSAVWRSAGGERKHIARIAAASCPGYKAGHNRSPADRKMSWPCSAGPLLPLTGASR